MVPTSAQRVKRMRLEKQPLQLSRAEKTDTWKIVDVEVIFMEILSRVSAKSLSSFKTLSKHWYESSGTKYFYELQLEKSRKNSSFIVCPIMESAMKLYLRDAKSFKPSLLNTIDPSQRSQEDFMYMISSFNGLICCVNLFCDEDVESKFCDLQIWICNPCTRETLLLPQGTPSFDFVPSVGVAYDSDICDYRIFRVFCARVGYYFCEVYSSKNGSWKIIGSVPRLPMRSGLRPFRTGHIFVGGKIYWLVSLDEPGEILSVDLEGRFDVMNLPKYSDDLNDENKITEATHLLIFQGSLALFVLHPGQMDIWVWKDNGEKYSWDLVLAIDTPIRDEELVLSVTSLKNKLVCVNETHWRIYDVETKIWRKIRGPRTGFCNPAIFPFTESILPCNGGVGL
ncbi:PREDICTED: putative F-box protein At3g10430 [Camelina sativa]|uniref:F-box protein At3g10430 n=1 Tax=Camelina sativa TaxID=90675 RepID=A0ABM0ZM54_CAMSA|nr:PREDICTED: putative F-box protein At3g10430 [Camelina sativa]XP_010517691.1 PREDICTED: putative F-box protein At3g10430 [Camelina sativa]